MEDEDNYREMFSAKNDSVASVRFGVAWERIRTGANAGELNVKVKLTTERLHVKGNLALLKSKLRL